MDTRTYTAPVPDLSSNSDGSARAREIVDFRSAEGRANKSGAVPPRHYGLIEFLSELQRRRVCRAVTMYCVALWLVCQVVEIVSPQLGLPEWTLKLVIVQGILGFPIALIVSWLFDVTPHGLKLDCNAERRESTSPSNFPENARRSRLDQVIDCGLLGIALIIGFQIALGAISSDSKAAPLIADRIAVMPFPVTSVAGSESLSAALLIELQHELARQSSVTVMAPTNPASIRNGWSLTGAVVVRDDQVRVTAILVDNGSGEVTWSRLIQLPFTNLDDVPAAIAVSIVTALAIPDRVASTTTDDSVPMPHQAP